MAVRFAWPALAASVLLLGGCATAPAMPAPLSPAEIKGRMASTAQQWWQAMFPSEPQPAVDPLAYLPRDEASAKIVGCLKAADIEGLLFGPDESWIYLGSDPDAADEVNRTYYVCAQQYPLSFDDEIFLSDEQREWIYDYQRERLVPCLQLLGYSVANRSTAYEPVVDDSWAPYYEMYPTPAGSDWERIDLRCPPSPVGPLNRPNDD